MFLGTGTWGAKTYRAIVGGQNVLESAPSKTRMPQKVALVGSIPVSSKENDRAKTNGGGGLETYHGWGGVQNRCGGGPGKSLESPEEGKMSEKWRGKCPKNGEKLSEKLSGGAGTFLNNFCQFGRCFCLAPLSSARPL